jgi:hypothetical protein
LKIRTALETLRKPGICRIRLWRRRNRKRKNREGRCNLDETLTRSPPVATEIDIRHERINSR